MNWPLDINDKTYTNANFAGRKYVVSFPELLSDWLASSKDRYSGYSSTLFLPTFGEVALTVSKYRNWAIGMRLVFTDASSPATNPVAFSLLVVSYNPETGQMFGMIDARTTGRAPVFKWRITAKRTLAVYSGAKTVVPAQGGLGGGDIFAKRSRISAPSINDVPEVFNDFISPIYKTVGGPKYPVEVSISGTGSIITTSAAFPDDREGAAGIVQLTAGSSVNSYAGLRHSSGYYAVSPVYEMEYRSKAYIQTLSDAGNRYKFQIGLGAFSSAHTSDIVSYGGITFEYSDNVNSGRWQVRYGQNSTIVTLNTSVAVTAGWHKFELRWNAVTMTFLIDGVSVGTTTTGLPTSAGYNCCSPSQLIRRSTGSSPRSVWVDYYYLRAKAAR